MARELRVINVMVRLEPSVHEILVDVLNKESEMASGFMRGLLLKELQRRGLLDDGTVSRLVGTAR